MLVINNVRCKLLSRVFAVINKMQALLICSKLHRKFN